MSRDELLGDSLVLGTPKGPHAFPIVAVAVDFTSDQGFALMDRQTYVEFFDDPLVNMFQLYLKPGTDVENTRARPLVPYCAKSGPHAVAGRPSAGQSSWPFLVCNSAWSCWVPIV